MPNPLNTPVAPAASPTLRMVRMSRRIGMVACAMLGLVIGFKVLISMLPTQADFSEAVVSDSRLRSESYAERRRDRAAGRYIIFCVLASIGVGGFVGLASYGLVHVTLRNYFDRKLRWSVYRLNGDTTQRVASGLSYDEAEERASQLGNRELGATFRTEPE